MEAETIFRPLMIQDPIILHLSHMVTQLGLRRNAEDLRPIELQGREPLSHR